MKTLPGRDFYVCSVCVLSLLLVGCKSSGPKDLPPTPSGLPEVSLAARPAKAIQAVAREFFLSRGYTETQSAHVYESVFDKPTKSGRASRALRVRLRLVRQVDGSWRLIGRPMGVEAWRSELESETDVPNGVSQIQGFLVEIKNRIESTR